MISGINILHRASASEAFHNSADSGAQPRCHPETRIEMQEKLLKWCINSEWPSGQAGTESCDTRTEPSILWVHGPAGAGKSAIMKTLSQRLEEAGRLGGTFFFKRGHSTRGNAKVLFTTIALQLAVNSLQLRNRISATVEQNPTLVARSIGVQLQELILNPCEGLEDPPWIIIIDGLDECEGENVQQEVLRLIEASAQRRIPLRFVVASRPEAHIHEVFDGLSFHDMYRAFNIDSSFHDVRTYLVSEFARIHREHSTMAMVPLPWPSKEVLESLVDKSSGYFIYASTVINFVDDKYFRPTQRLEVIQNLSGSGSGLLSPFTALDVLYTQILSAVPKNPHLVPILRVVDIFPYLLSPKQIDALLGLRPEDTELSLRGLHSVVQLCDADRQMDQCLSFTHASFSDFLRDPARAGDFYIRDWGGLVELARLVFTELGYNYEDCTKNQIRPPGLCVHVRLL
ncbi:hypothetical protein GGX14DRAFT_366076 [Mycena pura]|uniref:Nephrocystin 3-like N-terminal domain-containing protein n=1 Tax=Mycena pura TaxID=153505 RepID=A0AAD6VHP8_9AGAR|nr:hypothetical protein GGX14DRAFT_366076 [Mycena pura]